MYSDCEDFDYEPYENDREEWELNQLQQDRDHEDTDEPEPEDDGDRYPGEWICEVCGYGNSKIDGSCQGACADEFEDDFPEQDSEDRYGYPRPQGWTDNF